MKQDVQITFTIEMTRDTDEGDSLDGDILADVALDQLIDDRDNYTLIYDVTYL